MCAQAVGGAQGILGQGVRILTTSKWPKWSGYTGFILHRGAGDGGGVEGGRRGLEFVGGGRAREGRLGD